AAAGGLVYFSADDGVSGAEPWRTDGTIEGTRAIGDLEPGPAASTPRRFRVIDDLLYFQVTTVSHGDEPWVLRVDPTPPLITVSPADTSGWFNGDVPVSFTITDPESAITRTIGCDGGTVTTDTPGQLFECGAASEGGFTNANVTVRRDATPPSLSCPGNITQETTTASTLVAYPDAVVSDALDPSPAVTYAPPRGQPFLSPGGTVNVTATDHAGNTATCAFDVRLESGATPTVTCLDSVVREPTDSNGLKVTSYPPEAVSGFDAVDGTQLQFEYDPPPGDTFAPESTTAVSVTAVNSGGHRSTPCTFNLSVTCTTDECRAKLAEAKKKRSEYSFGCSSAGGAVGFAPVLWSLLLAVRRRRRSQKPAQA
ncbi:MAG: HYR domain-containing protein, partial [Myxococcaceae bacterium]